MAYQGWPSWDAWNVALWIGNDERLYRMAMALIAENKGDKAAAAKAMMAGLSKKTPDGATYTEALVLGAIEHFTD